MRREARHSGGGAAGFSLVELIVVLAVIGILAGISIPVVRMFSQNDLQRGVRPLTSMLRAARVYAATFNVNTAVVYEIAPFPVDDTILGQTVRVLSGAMVVYQLPNPIPSTIQYPDNLRARYYVPTPQYGGEFQPFEPGFCVLLQEPPSPYDAFPKNLAHDMTGDPLEDFKKVTILGMQTGIAVYRGYYRPDPRPDDGIPEEEFDPAGVEYFVGHIFDGKGALLAEGKQRFSILFAPMPDEPREERMWTTRTFEDLDLNAWKEGLPQAQGTMGYQGQEVTIYRSTGRIKTGSLQP
ncbi:MAG TPA: prepilin-type N-terminal cleavage/methylation domain-containing protein [Candidatus Hydrogenedentes bacterium]|nr:prepilin-type N-terminal cleavage/methylation domain-containing protein [Candidatus Hydrogenedentota bacterium]